MTTEYQPQLDTPPTMSAVERDTIGRSLIAIAGVLATLDGLPQHRMYSLSKTKLEESALWLRERLRNPNA